MPGRQKKRTITPGGVTVAQINNRFKQSLGIDQPIAEPAQRIANYISKPVEELSKEDLEYYVSVVKRKAELTGTTAQEIVLVSKVPLTMDEQATIYSDFFKGPGAKTPLQIYTDHGKKAFETVIRQRDPHFIAEDMTPTQFRNALGLIKDSLTETVAGDTREERDKKINELMTTNNGKLQTVLTRWQSMSPQANARETALAVADRALTVEPAGPAVALELSDQAYELYTRTFSGFDSREQATRNFLQFIRNINIRNNDPAQGEIKFEEVMHNEDFYRYMKKHAGNDPTYRPSFRQFKEREEAQQEAREATVQAGGAPPPQTPQALPPQYPKPPPRQQTPAPMDIDPPTQAVAPVPQQEDRVLGFDISDPQSDEPHMPYMHKDYNIFQQERTASIVPQYGFRRMESNEDKFASILRKRAQYGLLPQRIHFMGYT